MLEPRYRASAVPLEENNFQLSRAGICLLQPVIVSLSWWQFDTRWGPTPLWSTLGPGGHVMAYFLQPVAAASQAEGPGVPSTPKQARPGGD